VTKTFSSLPSLLAIYRSGDPRESSYAPRRPLQPRNQPTYPDLQSQVPPYYQQQQQWNPPGWKNWSTQYQHPWIQGWRGGHNQGNPQAPPIPMSNHPYPQFPPNTPQCFPCFVPPPLPPIPQQQPLQYQNASSPKLTLLPSQPVPNPNNKPPQPLHNVEIQAFSTYFITPVPVQEIQLRSGKVMERQRPSVVIQEEEEEETTKQPMDDTRWEDVIIQKNQEPKIPQNEPSQIMKVPPYLDQLVIEKPTTRLEFDILNELKNICVKSPLLQAIKDILIYSKVVKKLCIKKPGRKKTYPPTVHLIGGLSEYISEQPKLEKYGNPGNPVVTITINEVSIGNTLIHLGESINVMTTTTLEQLQLQPLLRPTPTILELADKTRVIPEGILDDIMVTLASWEYLVDFIVIHSKDPTKVHHVILGRPWLATTNACISCREGEMTISNGLSIQNLTIYPPNQPIMENIW
jgi:hypothetical protein